MTRLTFLGTGGGRFVTLNQERSTGGIYLEDGYKVHIDPGPGAVHALKRNRIDQVPVVNANQKFIGLLRDRYLLKAIINA